jgi:aconitate hydratase
MPLTFANESDYEQVSQGDTWEIEGVREAVASGETKLIAKSEAGEEIPLEARLLPREREVLLAGGMLKHLREGGQERIGIVEGDSASTESRGPQSRERS